MRFFTERRNAFWLSLAFAITFACAPVLAQAAPQSAPPPPPQKPQPNLFRATPPIPPMAPEEGDAQRTISGPYRLTYIVTDMDGSKRVGSQHYAIVLDADAKISLRLGTKIPVETGEFKAIPSVETQITYIDVGMNIQARLRQFANGLELSSRVEQSAVDSQQSVLKSPVIRATSLDSTVLLNENKPVILGNIDTPGTTHSLQVQVELSRVH